MCTTGQCAIHSIRHAAHPGPEEFTDDPHRAQSRKAGPRLSSTLPNTLEVTGLSCIWLETQILKLERRTYSYQQLEEILGSARVPGKLLETKTGQLHLMSVRDSQERRGRSQDNFSKIGSIYHLFNWKAATTGLFQASSETYN